MPDPLLFSWPAAAAVRCLIGGSSYLSRVSRPSAYCIRSTSDIEGSSDAVGTRSNSKLPCLFSSRMVRSNCLSGAAGVLVSASSPYSSSVPGTPASSHFLDLWVQFLQGLP